MVTRINFTNRGIILPEDAKVEGRTEGNRVFLTAELDTSVYGFDDESKILLNVRSSGVTTSNFDLGTVGKQKPLEDFELEDFSGTRNAKFAFIVTDPEDNIVLGLIKDQRILFDDEDEDEKKGILGIDEAELGDRIWKLDWEEDTDPVLHMNNKLYNPKGTAVDPTFVSLVYPEILRMITRKQVELHESEMANSEWETFFENISEGQEEDFSLDALLELRKEDKKTGGDSLEEAMDQICDTYASQYKLLELFNQDNGGTENE